MKKIIGYFSLITIIFSVFAPFLTFANEIEDEAKDILSETLVNVMNSLDNSKLTEDFQQKSDDSINLQSNEYVVTYNLNGGYWTEDGSTDSREITYTTNEILSTNWKTPSKQDKCIEGNNNNMKCMFDGWYYTGLETRFTGYVTENVTVYAKWLPFNNKTINLGNSSLVIMDRNIGATSNDPYSTSSYGLQFQRGNNYGFKPGGNGIQGFPNNELGVDYQATDWNDHISTYYNSKWRKMNPWNNGSTKNDNLRGGLSLLSGDKVRQGPCPGGYHIPTVEEREKLGELLNITNYYTVRSTLSLPLAGYRRYQDTTEYSSNNQGYYWSSTPNGGNNAYSMYFQTNNKIYWKYNNGMQYRSYGYPIRCFQDVEKKPLRYNLNGGINAENNPISTNYWIGILNLESPERDNSIFQGWYTGLNFDELSPVTTNEINSDDEIIDLYAKWGCFNGYENLGDRCIKTDNGKTATLLDGKTFNKKIKSIAKKNQSVNSYSSYDSLIEKIKNADELPQGITGTISTTGSEYPVYARYNDVEKILYYYSEATTIYLNEDSSYMFGYLTKLKTLDLRNFDTSNVTNMEYMFNQCNKLTELNISNFNTSKVTNMNSMFANCEKLKALDLRNFDTSNVTSMMSMFYGDKDLEILDVSSFDTKNVTNMNYMFMYCNGLKELNLSTFSTSKVIYMDSLFRGCNSLTNLDLSNFDTSNVVNMSQMFYGCSSLKNLNLNGWETNKVREMYYMFNGCSSLENLDLSSFNTKSVTSMHYMFNGCTSLKNLNLSNFNTVNVSSMNYMFNGCSSLENLDLSSFNTSKVSDMSYMFTNCNNLKTIYVGLKFRTGNLTYSSSSYNMFENTTSLVGGNGTKYYSSNPKDKTYARIDFNGTPGYFTLKGEYKPYAYLLPGSSFNVTLKALAQTGNTNIYTYTQDENITKILRYTGDSIPESIPQNKIVEISAPDSIEKVYARYDEGKIYYKSNAKTIELNTNSSYMFNNFKSLGEIDLKDFNTSDVTSMSNMFNGCRSLTGLDLRKFNTRNVTTMYSMFESCSNLEKLNVSSFDTSNVTDMTQMFNNCTNLKELDIQNFNTSNVEYAYNLFANCQNLTELNLSNFNTSKLRDLSQFFIGCTNLQKVDLSSFDTKNVTDMSRMFAYCYNLTGLDLSSFDTKNVTKMESMFNSTPRLKTIYIGENFQTNSSILSGNMFTGAISIVGGNGTKYNKDHVDGLYAIIDDENNSGYFTNILDKPYTIGYELNGGIITGEKTKYTARDEFTLINPTREGYNFIGWIGSNGDKPEITVIINKGTVGNLNYTAQWKLIPVITPSAGGGQSITPAKQETKVTEQEHNSADNEDQKVTNTQTKNPTSNTVATEEIKQQVKKVEDRSLTRGEVAIMTNILLEVYPQLVEGKQELDDVTNACSNYADEQNFTKDEKKAITRLCKLSIMGIHNDTNEPLNEFLVNSKSTNDEFSKVINRSLSTYTEKDFSVVKDALKKLEGDEENVVFGTVYEVFMGIKNIFN